MLRKLLDQKQTNRTARFTWSQKVVKFQSNDIKDTKILPFDMISIWNLSNYNHYLIRWKCQLDLALGTNLVVGMLQSLYIYDPPPNNIW